MCNTTLLLSFCCCTKSGGLVRVMLPPGTFERMFICVHELSINRYSAHHAPYVWREVHSATIHSPSGVLLSVVRCLRV